MNLDELRANPSILEYAEGGGTQSWTVAPEGIASVCRTLRESGWRLSAITAVDWHPAEPRFEVVYLVHSIAENRRLRLVCRLDGEAAEIESVTGVWSGANWYEREVFDLFGIVFRNHPNLTRIMMPETWEGHPLRRDYPTHGHKYSYTGDTVA